MEALKGLQKGNWQCSFDGCRRKSKWAFFRPDLKHRDVPDELLALSCDQHLEKLDQMFAYNIAAYKPQRGKGGRY